jgi:hypothetical protein
METNIIICKWCDKSVQKEDHFLDVIVTGGEVLYICHCGEKISREDAEKYDKSL